MKPIVHALYYVPLAEIPDLPALIQKLTVTYTSADDEDTDSDEGDDPSPQAEKLKCYSLALKGYIGVPRTFGFQHFAAPNYFDKTTRRLRMPHAIPRTITPRDPAQAKFWGELAAVCKQPRPNDIIVNARTGAGKTETCLWLFQEEIQRPLLVTVPTNKLRRQWLERIIQRFGKEWADRYVGHIQQDKTDYQGRLIVLGLAPSLAFRDYPAELRNYFDTIWFDEFHKIGAPRMSRILHLYGASLRIGGTATNRRDALRRVCDLHMGKPKVVSEQEIMRPRVYTIPFTTHLPATVEIRSDYTVKAFLARNRERTELVARIVHERGYLRDRNVLFLSDNIEQLQRIMAILRTRYAVPEDDVGLIVGKIKTGKWRVNRNGRKVKEEIKMTEAQQDYVAANCKLIGATYGIFDTGADVARLDMGVEATPRTNVRQAMGRTQRILSGKPEVEWYSISDEVWYYDPDEINRYAAASVFAPSQPPRPRIHAATEDANEARKKAFRDQGGVIHPFSF